jgi:DNA-directed RNA polymerase II subunit RPB2
MYMQVDVNTEVGVIHDYALRELRLFTDYGRTSRPLFIVEEGNQLAFKRQHLEALINRCGMSFGVVKLVDYVFSC